MDFGLSEDQTLLEQTVLRFGADSVPVERVRAIQDTDTAHDPEIWKGLTDLGLAGILVPEAHGGAGMGLLDATVAGRALGFHAVPSPFVSTAIMAATALGEDAGSDAAREWLPKIASGDAIIGVAATEAVAQRDDAGLSVVGGKIQGTALFVFDLPTADVFLVAIGRESLALVAKESAGLELKKLQTIDLTRRFGELRFSNVEPLAWIGGEKNGKAIIERMLDAGRIALAADALGACDRAMELAIGYAKERKQFNRLIGSFQGLKHLLAELAAEIEPARALAWYAAHTFDARGDDARLVASHTKSLLSEVGTKVLRGTTEAHGGIGFTDEYPLHIWFKRVMLDRQLLGGPTTVREEAARLQGWA